MANEKKIALVTGGSRGLGKNTVQHLAQKGIAIILTWNSNEAEAKAVVEEVKAGGGKAAALQLNTANASGFDAFAEELKQTLKNSFGAEKIDFLVNNAGTALYAPVPDTTEQQFDEVMNIHLKGPFFLTQKLLPLLNDGGGIINLSSGLARFSFPGSAAYAMMKGGIEVYSRYLAKELGARGIRANTVAPGAIETDFGGGGVRDNKELNGFVSSVTALGRAGVSDDIGGVVAFLCTEEGRWINGQRIEVSGGMML